MDYISEIEIEKVKEEFPKPGPLVTENPLANMAHIPIIPAIQGIVSWNTVKTVRFSNKVNVILVPTIQEYLEGGIFYQIWWRNVDYDRFTLEYKREILNSYNTKTN